MASRDKGVSAEVTQAARVLARYGASLGGKARWKNTTFAERSEHFRRMAQTRWKQVRAQTALESKSDDSSPQNLKQSEQLSGVKNDTENVCE